LVADAVASLSNDMAAGFGSVYPLTRFLPLKSIDATNERRSAARQLRSVSIFLLAGFV